MALQATVIPPSSSAELLLNRSSRRDLGQNASECLDSSSWSGCWNRNRLAIDMGWIFREGTDNNVPLAKKGSSRTLILKYLMVLQVYYVLPPPTSPYQCSPQGKLAWWEGMVWVEPVATTKFFWLSAFPTSNRILYWRHVAPTCLRYIC